MACFLRRIDTFGKLFSFNIDRQPEYLTNLGGVLSLLVNTAFLISIWYFGQDIYLRESPKILKKSQQHSKTPLSEVTPKIFFFAFRVSKQGKQPHIIDDFSLIEYDFYHSGIYKNEKGEHSYKNHHLPVSRCNTSHVSEQALKDFKLDEYYCANLRNLSLGGSVYTENLKYLKYKIQMCSKKTEKKHNITCKSREEFFKFMENTYIDYIMIQELIDEKNFKHPIKFSYNFKYQSSKEFLMSSLYFYKAFYYHKAHVKSDTGLIFENHEEEQDFLEYQESNKELRYRKPISNNVSVMYIFLTIYRGAI